MKGIGILGEKSYAFALRIIKLYKFVSEQQHEWVLSKQVLRSGTAIGAIAREGINAQSKRDFLNKMNTALKEADETDYWLSLLKDSDYITQDSFDSIDNDCKELIAILSSTVRTLKENLDNDNNKG